jgi:hypothetical protein
VDRSRDDPVDQRLLAFPAIATRREASKERLVEVSHQSFLQNSAEVRLRDRPSDTGR